MYYFIAFLLIITELDNGISAWQLLSYGREYSPGTEGMCGTVDSGEELSLRKGCETADLNVNFVPFNKKIVLLFL